MKWGNGKMTYASGNYYEGQWASNKRNGQGTMFWLTSDEKYEGNWEDNFQSGFGAHVWLDGSTDNKLLRNRYVGYWNGAEDHLTHEVGGYLDLHLQVGTNHTTLRNATNLFSSYVFGGARPPIQHGTFACDAALLTSRGRERETPARAGEMVSAVTQHAAAFPNTPGFFYLPLSNVHAPLATPGGAFETTCTNDYTCAHACPHSARAHARARARARTHARA
jgi:hypothetical protein